MGPSSEHKFSEASTDRVQPSILPCSALVTRCLNLGDLAPNILTSTCTPEFVGLETHLHKIRTSYNLRSSHRTTVAVVISPEGIDILLRGCNPSLKMLAVHRCV